ncbi:MAG: STAS domain-containing protein [Actinomycetota bacterium]
MTTAAATIAPPSVVARASGVLDSDIADRLAGELLALTSSGGEVVVDLARVRLIDSGALSVFVVAAKHARAHGGRLVLRHPSGVVADVLRVASLSDRGLSLELAED